jgi:hypothetical protein
MEAVSAVTFMIRLAGTEIIFERDESGPVVALVPDQAGTQTRGSKRLQYRCTQSSGTGNTLLTQWSHVLRTELQALR